MLEVLSYGAGKQTFAMLVLVEKGLLPAPDLIVFADTLNEKPQTYWHIENVAKPLAARLGIEFVTISKGNLYEYLWDHQYNPQPPKCTLDYKIRPINIYLFKRFGFKRGFVQAHVWVGISTDEAHRNTASAVMYVEKIFPLLELGLSRQDCINTIVEAGYPEPDKSGCDICPHNNTKAWLLIKKQEPARFQKALRLEANARKRDPKARLPVFGRSLHDIAAMPEQLELDLTLSSSDFVDDDNCTTGSCMV